MQALRHAFAKHDHARSRAVDIAALDQEVMSSSVGAEYNDGRRAELKTDNGAIILGPLMKSKPGLFCRSLVKVANQWQS